MRNSQRIPRYDDCCGDVLSVCACAGSVTTSEIGFVAQLWNSFRACASPECDPNQKSNISLNILTVKSWLDRLSRPIWKAKTIHADGIVASHSFSIFDPSLDLIVRGHYENIEHIRQDWRRGSSSFNYQPKVNMRTGQVVGAAALIRW